MKSLQWKFRVGTILFVAMSGLALKAQENGASAGLINRTGTVYSAHNSAIYVIDRAHDGLIILRTGQPAKVLKTSSGPISIATNERTGCVYVANSARLVTVIDGATDQVLATVPTAGRPYDIAVDETADRVFVSNTFSNMLTVIDGKTNAVHNVKTGSADALAVDQKHGKVYLLGYESDSLTVCDEAAETTAKLATGANHQWAIAATEAGLYVSHVQDAEVVRIDPDSNALLRIATGRMPCAFAVDSTHHELYVVGYGDASISAIDMQTDKVLWTIPLGGHPQAVAVDPARRLVYVADAQGRTVSIVEAGKPRILKKVSLRDSPYALAVDLLSHRVVATTIGRSPYAEVPVP
jgi:YVTN family beta-propeller protein